VFYIVLFRIIAVYLAGWTEASWPHNEPVNCCVSICNSRVYSCKLSQVMHHYMLLS